MGASIEIDSPKTTGERVRNVLGTTSQIEAERIVRTAFRDGSTRREIMNRFPIIDSTKSADSPSS